LYVQVSVIVNSFDAGHNAAYLAVIGSNDIAGLNGCSTIADHVGDCVGTTQAQLANELD
jgi:hypothetical protein